MRGSIEKRLVFLVSQEEAGKRLDRFLQEQNLSVSRSHIKRLVDDGRFEVNNRHVKAGFRLKRGDRVTGEIPPPRPLEAQAENIPLHILHEDDDIIVVDKAPGMVVHPASGVFSGTLVNALLFHCKDLSGINGVLRPGIVHRLDRDTSGVMVVAKNDLAHESLVRQFKARRVHKRYVGLVYGGFPKLEGHVDASLGRHPKRRTMVSIHSRSPREAVTRWKVIERFRSVTVLEIFPRTGRTHQIRVHLSSIGHPILGDPVYGRKSHLKQIDDPRVTEIVENFKRQALHASDLGFLHPKTGETVAFHAPVSSDMQELIDSLRKFGRSM